MKTGERLELIKRNIQEILGEKELEKLLTEKKEISLYWGTMPTGSISIAYFFPMMKIADFLKAGIKVKILFADLHAALDTTPWTELKKRTEYYKKAILTILETLNVPTKNLEFVLGSDFQLSKKYSYDLLKLSTFATLHDAQKASSEVIKQKTDPKISGLLYPLMQALDEEYLNVDIQFGGMDQRKIMVFARENLPKLGYESRIEIMNPIIRGLIGEKMSSSDKASKIDLMDDELTVTRKINSAECVIGDPNNGLMALAKYLIFSTKEKVQIKRPEKFGGNVTYKNYEQLEEDFIKKNLHPKDLKDFLAIEINTLLKNFRNNKELKKLHSQAYPTEN